MRKFTQNQGYTRKQHNRPNDTIKIVTIHDRKTVVLLQDMFPITENYITNQYIRGGQPVRIADIDIVADVSRFYFISNVSVFKLSFKGLNEKYRASYFWSVGV